MRAPIDDARLRRNIDAHRAVVETATARDLASADAREGPAHEGLARKGHAREGLARHSLTFAGGSIADATQTLIRADGCGASSVPQSRTLIAVMSPEQSLDHDLSF